MRSKSEESSENEKTILNTLATIVLDKPKQACALGPNVKLLDGYCSIGELGDHNNYTIEDVGIHHLSLPETIFEHQSQSITKLNVFDSECTANASPVQEEGNTEGTPTAERDQSNLQISTGSEDKRVTNCRNKRRKSAER